MSTFVIVPVNAPQAAALKQFIDFVLGPGQSYGPALGFSRLPAAVRNADEQTLNRLWP